jgi:hypothetical protein
MSEIKFRVWSEETQSFLFPGGQADQKIGICSFVLCVGCVKLKNFESTVIEQFSGLLDVDGNDIYEGDILACPNCQSDPKWIFSSNTLLDWNTDESPRDFFGDLKVIGNIHQYKYLLD